MICFVDPVVVIINLLDEVSRTQDSCRGGWPALAATAGGGLWVDVRVKNDGCMDLNNGFNMF